MPVYRYKAVNASGEVAVGELEAANESEIVDRLRDQGLMPMQVARAAAGGGDGNGAAAVGAARGARRRGSRRNPSRATTARDHARARDAAARRACRSTARSRS